MKIQYYPQTICLMNIPNAAIYDIQFETQPYFKQRIIAGDTRDNVGSNFKCIYSNGHILCVACSYHQDTAFQKYKKICRQRHCQCKEMPSYLSLHR